MARRIPSDDDPIPFTIPTDDSLEITPNIHLPPRTVARYQCQSCAFETTSVPLFEVGHSCALFSPRGEEDSVPPTPAQLLQRILVWVMCPDLFDSEIHICKRVQYLLESNRAALFDDYLLFAIFALVCGVTRPYVPSGEVHARAVLAEICVRTQSGLEAIYNQRMARA
jgi:hypothetical protein